MENTNTAFTPLTTQEIKQSTPPITEQPEWTPIFPVPDDALEPNIHKKGQKPSLIHQYLDEKRRLLGYICRFEGAKKEFHTWLYYQNGNDFAWRYNQGFPKTRPLYGLDILALRPMDTVVVCEGEKATEAARSLLPNYVCITSPNGAKAPQYADWSPLKNRKVIIWADNDENGIKYAENVQNLCLDVGAVSVGIVLAPEDKPQKWDAHDALHADGWNTQQAMQFITRAQFKRRETVIPAPFELKEDGVYYEESQDDDKPAQRICSKLEVLASTSNETGSNHGRLLRWKDNNGLVHQWAMPMCQLGGDGKEVRSYLLGNGLYIEPKRHRKVLEYIQRVEPANHIFCADRVGWQGDKFIFPDAIIPNNTEMIFQGEMDENNAFRVLGTLEEWQQHIATYAVGNSRLILCLCAAFASPLLRLMNEESGGFHLRGGSSVGKTTALCLAGSVWGGNPDGGYLNQWRATSNAIEATAQAHNDCLLCLDEMGQVDGREVGETVYMLANEKGKTRMNKNAGLRQSLRWKLLLLSTGEISLADKMAEAGKHPHAGMETRLVDIPENANHGLFSELHSFEGGAELSIHLKTASKQFYGTAIREFLKHLTAEDMQELEKRLQKLRDDFVHNACPESANGQVRRVASRFGLLYIGGILACEYGILPFDKREIATGLYECFNDWLKNRGTTGQLEDKKAYEQVKHYLERFGESKFSFINRNKIITPARLERMGYREEQLDGSIIYWVFPDSFKEICKGYDPHNVAKVLVQQKILMTDNEGESTYPKSFEGMKRMRMYRISDDIFENSFHEAF